jgi:hypothetical protein
MARHEQRTQRDLFTTAGPPRRLPPEVRQALLALLEAMLRDVALGDGTADREVADEPDHA